MDADHDDFEQCKITFYTFGSFQALDVLINLKI